MKNYPRPQNVCERFGVSSNKLDITTNLFPIANITKSRTNSMKKEVAYRWGPDQKKTFAALKEILCSESVLVYPDGPRNGLPQVQREEENLVAYFNLQMNISKGNESSTERKLPTVV